MKNKRFKTCLISIAVLLIIAVLALFKMDDAAQVVVSCITSLMVIIPVFIAGDSLRKSDK